MTGLRTAIVLAAAAAVAWACSVRDIFTCTEDAQCSDGATVGVCESTGYCSFPDAACMSGRRYGERAPQDLAGRCVGDDDGTTGSGDDGPVTTMPTTSASGTSATSTSTSTSASTTTPVDPDTSTDGSISATDAEGSITDSSGATSLDEAGESSTTEPGDPPCELVFVDEFDGDAPDPSWDTWVNAGCALSVADGHLYLQVAPSDLEWISTGLWGGPFTLVGGRARIQILPFTSQTLVSGVWLSVIDAASCELQLAGHADTVYAKHHSPEIDVDLASVPIDLQQPLWLQVRIDVDDFVWWEYSLDGQQWMVLHGEANPCGPSDEHFVSVFSGDQFAGDPVVRGVERVEVCSPI